MSDDEESPTTEVLAENGSGIQSAEAIKQVSGMEAEAKSQSVQSTNDKNEKRDSQKGGKSI